MTSPVLQSQAKPKSPVIGKASGASSIPARSFRGAQNGSHKDTGLGSVLRSGDVQAKVKVGSPNDPAEHEADRIAQQVMRKEEPPQSKITQDDSVVRRKAVETKIEKRAIDDAPLKIQKKSTSNQMSTSSAQTPDHQAQSAISKLGPGAPLPTTERNFFEPRFGQDFSKVRIHNDAAADAAARAIDARAFAMGNQIAFARGEYNPGTQAGRTLMAHELTHTVQQGGSAGLAQGKLIRRAQANKSSDKKNGSQSEDDKALKGDGSAANPYVFGDAKLYLGKSDPSEAKGGDSSTTDKGGTIHIPTLTLPKKYESKSKVVSGRARAKSNEIIEGQAFRYTGREEKKSAAGLWLKFAKTELRDKIHSQLPTITNWDAKYYSTLDQTGEKLRFLRLKKKTSKSMIIIGTHDQIADHPFIIKPKWDEKGKTHMSMDVDHIHERQLGGAHGWKNFWMMDSKKNQKFGRSTRSAFEGDLKTALSKMRAEKTIWDRAGIEAPTLTDLKGVNPQWNVHYDKVKLKNEVELTDELTWTRNEIETGVHLEKLVLMSEKEALQEGLIYVKGIKPKYVNIFTHNNSGFRRKTRHKNGALLPQKGEKSGFYKGFNFESATYAMNGPPKAGENVGTITGTAFATNKKAKKSKDGIPDEPGVKIELLSDPRFGFGVYADQRALRKTIAGLNKPFKGASPAVITDGGISPEGAIFADGIITADKALFKGTKVPFYIRGNDTFIDFDLTPEQLSFGPVHVTDTSLQIGFDPEGLLLRGMVGVEVLGVGNGMLEAARDDGMITIKGLFNFDHDFLDPAQLSAEYNYTNDTFKIAGEIGVKSGVLPGVKSGKVKVSVTRENIEISGSLLMGGPLNGTELTISYAPKTGITIGGENIPLTPLAAIPGISSASATVFVNYKPEEEAWHVSGSGKVVMGIAGASGDVNVEIDGPYVDISGHLQVAKGPATGSLDFNATNAPEVTPPAAEAQAQVEQAPQDYEGLSALSAAVLAPPPAVKARGPVQDKMTVWGKGEASIAFGSILTGHAGLTLSKTGGVVISGGISLPPRLSIFEKKEFKKNLLDVNLSFPIWGINIVGYKLGIFANLGTTLNFSTFIGPAEIVGANVMAIMDLDNPSAATLKGKGRLEIPAGAGLRLDLYGGVSAELVVAGAMGKVGIYGTLGAEALISNDLEIDWSLAKGLSIATDTAIAANASLAFGISGSVDVWAPFYSDTYGPWDKEIGNIGGGLSFGANFPLNWDEQNGLNFDISKIDVAEPEIDSKALAKDAFGKVV